MITQYHQLGAHHPYYRTKFETSYVSTMAKAHHKSSLYDTVEHDLEYLYVHRRYLKALSNILDI